MKKIVLLLLLLLILGGCGKKEVPAFAETEPDSETALQETAQPETTPLDPVEQLLNTMSLEEKIGQMFLVRCPEENAAQLASQYHLGGYVLFGRDFQDRTPDSIRASVASWQEAVEIPMFIAVDEEGGTVCRVSSNPAFRAEAFPSPRTLYDLGGEALVGSVESEKAYLLHSLGINLNLGPVCDITTEPGAFMYDRSLGQSPEITARFVVDAARRMAEYQVGSVLKHFPGYGSNGDTHTGKAVDQRSLEQLQQWDLIPFEAGIRANSGAIMVSHNTVNALDDRLPASISPAVHGYLRYTMGFDGVVITDELSMGAVEGICDTEEAAVLAVLAGNDLLCTTDIAAQYQAVLTAVRSGRISEEMIDGAVSRVLRWKMDLNIL